MKPPIIQPPRIIHQRPPSPSAWSRMPLLMKFAVCSVGFLVVFAFVMFGLKAQREQAIADRKVAEEKSRIEAQYAAAQQRRQAAENAENARQEAIERANDPYWGKRGAKPKPSEWDGITPEVNAYLKANLKDYKSMELVSCSPVLTLGRYWAQRVKYRAKNSFGAYTLNDGLFAIHDGYAELVVNNAD